MRKSAGYHRRTEGRSYPTPAGARYLLILLILPDPRRAAKDVQAMEPMRWAAYDVLKMHAMRRAAYDVLRIRAMRRAAHDILRIQRGSGGGGER